MLRSFILSAFLIVFAFFHTSIAHAQRTSTLKKPVFPMLEYVNLSAELGFDSDILRGYGARVDDARRSADPSALAAQALLLSFAEEISLKTASTVTALAVLEEAARIVEEQHSRTAVSVIKAAADKIPGSQYIVDRLNEAMLLFGEMRGDGSFVAYIQVSNDCDRALDIYVDGTYKGFLFGGENMSYSTGNGTTTVRATDAFGNSATEIFSLQPEQTMTWTITP